MLNNSVVQFLILLLIIFFALAYFSLSLLVLVTFVKTLMYYGMGRDGDDLRNTGLILIAFFGFPLLIWRAYSASVQANVAERGHITERFSKAVDQLAAARQSSDSQNESNPHERFHEIPNFETRMGALYALESISVVSKRDHLAVMDVICSYVRSNANVDFPDTILNEYLLYSPSAKQMGYRARQDIYTALLIIGRRQEKRRDLEEADGRFRIDLSATKLRQIDLDNANLTRGYFASTNFTDASLKSANLSKAWFHRAIFDRAGMMNCILNGAALPKTDLRKALDLEEGQVRNAFGVCSGAYKTLLPNNFPNPETEDWGWFTPSSPDLPERKFLLEFSNAYNEYLNRRNW